MAAKVMRLGLPRCVPTGTVSADADADQSKRQHTQDAARRVVRMSSAEVMIEVCAKTPRQSRESQRVIRAGAREARSEEHTSELQSLMRISYAVFCLKKKKN